jgi:hypothetical protein
VTSTVTVVVKWQEVVAMCQDSQMPHAPSWQSATDNPVIVGLSGMSLCVYRKDTSSMMVSILLTALILWCVIWGLVGYIVGKPRNRANEGVIWGGLLGLIGVLVILAMDPRDPRASDQHGFLLPSRHWWNGGTGWYPDPTGRHQRRWFSGSEWTEHVDDGHGWTKTPDPIASSLTGASPEVE